MYQTELSHFISSELLAGQENSSPGPDENLLLSGMIDSFGIVRLVKFMEDTYDIEVSSAEVTLKNFKSVNAISAYVDRKINSA